MYRYLVSEKTWEKNLFFVDSLKSTEYGTEEQDPEPDPDPGNTGGRDPRIRIRIKCSVIYCTTAIFLGPMSSSN